MERWENIIRPYTPQQVKQLQGSVKIDYTLARLGAERLWKLLTSEPFVPALGALTGNQAMQQVRAGLKAIYVSGWQVAGDNNLSGNMYPDQGLYPCNSVPELVKKINKTLQRADQIDRSEGKNEINWYAPIIADAEAGFGGVLSAFELTKAMIEAGAAAIHEEDQLGAGGSRRCGHLSGRVIIPTKQFIKTLVASRLAADVLEVPTIIIARTDAESATYITSDIDENDDKFIDKSNRTEDGFYKLIGNPIERCIARGLAYAPYADVLWMETSHPDLNQAKKFAEGIHSVYPGKLLAYNLSPSFNWKSYLTEKEISDFQIELGKLGFVFQFVTLSGFHTLNHSMFELSKNYLEKGMTAYADFQEVEFNSMSRGYTAVKHQHEVGTNYFDLVKNTIDQNNDSTAMKGSTEELQFNVKQ